MLTIFVPMGDEQFDETTQTFMLDTYMLKLEHSLLSVSKWESKHEKPFISSSKTEEELLDYIRCMVVFPEDVPSEVFNNLSEANVHDIDQYIGAKMTATWFRNDRKKSAQRIMTAEVIYAQMVILRIPFQCETWHLNRLLTLIRAVVEEQTPKKKMSAKEIARQNRELNAARKKKLGIRD